MYGDTGLRHRKKKEDRGLKTEESKTKGYMRLETDTGQTVYTQREPETGQTAYIRHETVTGQTACTLRRQKTGSVLQLETDTGQTVYVQVEPETGQTALIRHETVTGQTANTSASTSSPPLEEDRRTARPSLLLKRGLTALPRLRFQPTDDDSARLPGTRTTARQTEDATPEENAFSVLQLEDTVDRLLPNEQVYNFRPKPETERKSSERPDRASYEQVATCLSSDDNLVYEDTRDDVQTQRYHTRKVEVDAKAGATRHLPRDSNSAAEQAGDTTDAKVGKTQHSLVKQTINASDAKADQRSTSEEIDYRNDLNRLLNCRKIPLNNQAKDRLPEIKAPRQKSMYTKGQNKQRQENKN